MIKFTICNQFEHCVRYLLARFRAQFFKSELCYNVMLFNFGDRPKCKTENLTHS